MKTRNSVRSSSLAVILAATLPLACNNGTSQSTSAPTGSESAAVAAASASGPAPASATPPAHPQMRGREPGRAGMMIRAAFDLPTLTDAQKTTLTNLEAQLQSAPTPREAMKAVQADVAAGIRANKLDTAKLQADYAAVDKVIQAHTAAEADAINAIHAALDATQRTALTASIRQKQAAHEAQRDARDATDAGVAEWTQRRLDHMTKLLDLDAAQQKAVGAILAREPMNPRAMRAHTEEGKKKIDAMLSAFEGDTFDAKKSETDATGDKSPHDAMQRDVTFVTQLLPILTADQREKLAVQREHMGLGFGRRPGGDDSPRGEGRGGPDDGAE